MNMNFCYSPASPCLRVRKHSGLRMLTVVLGLLLATGAAAEAHPDSGRALEGLRPHPRLLMSDDRLAALKAQAAADPVLDKAVRAVLAQADKELQLPLPEYQGVGPWGTSGKNHVYALGFAYRWTGDEKYARKVEQDLLAVVAFKDWNPQGSFLNTAEISHAVGLGFDWCYPALGQETRQKLSAGLLTNGIKPYLTAFDNKVWWTRTAFNWNQVCNGGTLMGMLGIAEVDPTLTTQVLNRASTSLPLALTTYNEDGLWPEGLDYWQYATEYTVWALAGLESALGTDLGIGDARRFPGLSRTGEAAIFGAGPFRQYVNFADTLENKKRWGMPYLFWLDAHYGTHSGEAAAMQQWPSVLDIVWYPGPQSPTKVLLPPLDKRFRGKVELATFRSAWDDPNALFASLKAGYNEVNHGHLDLGVFEMDALGVRWARDLGKDNYGLPGYFSDRKAGGQAWNIYRLRSVSHSVPLIDGQDQPLTAQAKMTGFRGGIAEVKEPAAVVDLGPAYPAATRAVRGLALVGGRRAVLVQDEFTLDAPHELTWAMTTDAAIQTEGNKATLTLGGRTLQATILSPADAEFSVVSAEQKPPDNPNRGVKRLLVDLKEAKGEVRLAVLLAPVWPDKKEIPVPELTALDQWIKPLP